MTDELRALREEMIDIKVATNDTLFVFEGRICDLEFAHASLTLRLTQLVADTLALQDDDISAVLRKHGEDIRAFRLSMGDHKPSQLLDHLERASSTLDPGPPRD